MDGGGNPAAIGGASNEDEEDDMQDELDLEPEPALTQAERLKRKERLHERMKVAVARVVENNGMAQSREAFNALVTLALFHVCSPSTDISNIKEVLHLSFGSPWGGPHLFNPSWLFQCSRLSLGVWRNCNHIS